MKKIADISMFESLMNESCHHVSDTMKSDVAVFNDMQDICDIVKSYGFDVSAVPDKKGVKYYMHRTAEMDDAMATLDLAYKTDKWWASRNINYRDTLKNEDGNSLVADLEVGFGGCYFGCFDRSGEVVADYEGDWVYGKFYSPGNERWGRRAALVGSVLEVEHNLDGTRWPDYNEYLSDSLIPCLQELKEKADLTISEANKWKERRAGLREKETEKAMKFADTIVTPTSSSDFASVPDPFFDDSYID